MPSILKQYKILLSCPSDVKEELLIAENVIAEVSDEISQYTNISLVSLHWSKDVLHGVKGTAQQQINRQIVEPSDAIIAIFATKLGTPTSEYDSGSIEEIEHLIAKQGQVWVYFSNMPYQLGSITPSELERVNKFKDKYKDKGIYDGYDSKDDFEVKLRNQLKLYMKNIMQISDDASKGSVSKQLPPIGNCITKSDFVEQQLLPCFIKATLNLNINDNISAFVRCIVVKYSTNETRYTVLEYGRAKARGKVGTRPVDYGIVGLMNKERVAILHDFQNDICYRMTDANYKTISVPKRLKGTVDDRLALLVAPIWKDGTLWGALSFDFFDIGDDEMLKDKNILRLIAESSCLKKILHNTSFFSGVLASFLFYDIVEGGKDFLH